jgi:serine/arginine repetitive matrix protein 2
MLAERDPNASGRTSRVSNMSAMSRATHRAHGGADKQDPLASAPGVMSMLRTSTEMGNLVGLTGNLSGVGNGPRAPQRRGASSRLSTASSMSGNSSRTSRHHRQWPSSSPAPQRTSMREPSGPQYIADTLSPTVMNLPGSSPLIPTRHRSSRYNKDVQRSFSMTNTTQSTFRLSSNRSLGSLRGPEHIQRPRSPYVYPARLRRPPNRPASPVLSDFTGSRPQRLHGHRSQGHIQQQTHRLRIPSDTNLGFHGRSSGTPRRPSRGHVPVYYATAHPHGDIPPVPPLSYPRVPLERPCVLKSSLKGSFSSGLTNVRNDSDMPSSDGPSPPTPRDGSSLEIMLSPTGTQVLVDTTTGVVMKEQGASDSLYYDYNEQFEREQILEPEVNPISTGFVTDIKTIQEERVSTVPPATPARGTWTSGTARISNTAIPGIVELPASPVARRITRDMILQALEPASTAENVADTADTPSTDDESEFAQHGAIHDAQRTTLASAGMHDLGEIKRFSILSQANTSVVDSSTLDFAVRYSIPLVTGAQVGSDPTPKSDGEPPLPPSTALGTEVDMSDLLAGYQHTEYRHEDDEGPKEKEKEMEPDAASIKDQVSESSSNHAHKSSDPQSFKSATDVLKSDSADVEPEKDDNAKSYKSFPDAATEKELSVKEVDAHSFKTAQDTGTPGRSVSMPAAKPLPAAHAEVQTPRRMSEAPVASPAPAVLRKPRVLPRESSFPLPSRLRISSKPSMKLGSISISASSSKLSVTQQSPPVPPRESSASKEAQRSMGVASFLFKRWGKKTTKDEDLKKTSNSSRETLQAPRPTDSVNSSQQSLVDAIATPEKAMFKENAVPAKTKDVVSDCAPPQVYNAVVAPSVHQHSFSSLSPAVVKPSSVYSPQDSSSRSRVQSSFADVPKAVDNRRDSQITTHLVWHGRKSLNLSNPTACTSELHLPLPTSNEDTTTDLRLSQYRYPGSLHYLPDLKEDSHEGSSLNTSASNLKNSNFRFPFGIPGGVRPSVDESALFSRRSSLGSYRRSALGSAMSHSHGLPSMNFSRMDLFDKLDEELHPRNSRSLDQLPVEVPDPRESIPQRTVSAGEMREKYRSLCDKLGQFNTPKHSASTEMTNMLLMRRALSPELLAEIDRVTVPSVKGLTERLSEFLPSLREYYNLGDQGQLTAEEAIMGHAIENIHEVGGPVQKRSSARLRPIPGSPNLVMMDDALYELRSKETENVVVVVQRDEGVDDARGEYRASESKAASAKHPKTTIAELEAQSPAISRPRAFTVRNQNLRASVESGLTRSLRSFSSSPTKTDTRPWNSDRNYPWATSNIPSVDISLPRPTAVRHSPRPGPSHLRNNISDTSIVGTFTLPVGSPFGTDSNSNSSAHARQLQRFSVFGRNGDQPHAVGERYPTSALNPPTAIFRDNFSTSDMSEDGTEPQIVRKGKFSLKKRLSSARNAALENNPWATNKSAAASNTPPGLSSPESTHLSANLILQDTAGEARAFTSNRHTFRGAEGMPTVVYHRHRLIGHLKRWWHKGGDLIRSLSRRSHAASSRL